MLVQSLNIFSRFFFNSKSMVSVTTLSLGKDNGLDRAWIKFQNSGHLYFLLFEFFSLVFIDIFIINILYYIILLFIDELLVATGAIFFSRSGKRKGIIWLVET